MRSEKSNAGVRSRPLRPWHVLALALLVLTVFAGYSLSSSSTEKDSIPPIISVPGAIPWGGALYGVATDRSDPIHVTATTQAGMPLAGSPDTTSGSGSNSFCFPVPSGSGLSYIRITATDSEGNTRTVVVTVR